jgi:hypothetical protein
VGEVSEPPLVVSYGGGVNSAAMLVGLHERGIIPVSIIFSDPGAEKPETYESIAVYSDWAVSVGMPPIVTVQNDGMYKTLENDCLSRHSMPSLVFGWKSCSDKYKRRPIEKYLSANGLLPCVMAIGIDAGEPHRVGSFDTNRITYRHFLLEWQWRREECVTAIQRHGLPVPVKSACFYCPASKKSEVVWLKNHHPELFDRAVLMERNAVGMTDVKGLGRHWSWEEIGMADEQQFKMFPETIEMPCMCFDGSDD